MQHRSRAAIVDAKIAAVSERMKTHPARVAQTILTTVCFLLLLCPVRTVHGASGMSLKVTGDDKLGYVVRLLYNGDPIAQDAGEFSAEFQNGSRELDQRIDGWRASSWTGDERRVILKGEAYLDRLKTVIGLTIEYQVITSHVVRKTIQLHQSDAHLLYYQVSNELQPVDAQKFWSFDQAESKGGPLHELFPAAGFRTSNGVTVGLLTDSGYRNYWNRIIRRDNGEFVKPAPGEISDTNLNLVSPKQESSKGHSVVSQTFGQELARNPLPPQPIQLPPASRWHKQGVPMVDANHGIHLRLQRRDEGVVIPVPVTGGQIYTLSFEYRSPRDFAARFWDADDKLRMLKDLTLYNDRVPLSGSQWKKFETTVYIPALQGAGGVLFLGNSGDFAENSSETIDITNLKLERLATRNQPYHRLEMDRPEQKTLFIFADEAVPDTARGYRLASQVYLADGLGFKGSDPEKVIYSDTMMLAWTAEPHVFRPLLVPSVYYGAAGEMYLRDSFYAASGLNNRELNQSLFELWGANQSPDGEIGTLVNANRGHIERKSNDSTPLWLIWALQNRKRFTTNLPMQKVRRAAEYCIRTYDPAHTGICRAQFIIGQNDVMEFPGGTSEIAVNQGMWAVTLRVIKELGIPGISDQISDSRIENAENAYRRYYDPQLKRVRPAAGVTDAIGFEEIFPEFLSLWIFNRKILTDEMVQNHLDQIPTMLPRKDAPYPETGTVRPILIGLTRQGSGWRYASESWHPMVGNEHASRYSEHRMDGIYYNGGSWMRIEVCGYATGKLHGWKQADRAIKNRLWAEINIDLNFPTSQEYLATDLAHPFFGFHRVFAWNSFVFQALQMAGLRTPEMDPNN
jgi:hypothetical protein